MPEDWCVDVIKPLYKGKGDKADPNNYRGITIVSCMGKLFTCVLNNRLSEYLRVNKLNGPEQAGFKAGYSTVDHIFTLKAMTDLFIFRHKKLYVCFVDFKKALDNVNVATYLELHLLLYAADTVLLAESSDDLQKSLNAMLTYCDDWDLTINTYKTKVMILSRRKIRKKHVFNFGNHVLETVDSYNDLGLSFNYNRKFKQTKNDLLVGGTRAMFTVLCKARSFNLKLFDVLVVPVIIYGCEVWSSDGCLEKIHLRFCKIILIEKIFAELHGLR